VGRKPKVFLQSPVGMTGAKCKTQLKLNKEI